jgi:hypothetical protein
MHVTFAVGYSVMPTKASDEQTNDAWLMLLFSGWYVVLLTVEASEGRPLLAGRADMNVRISRFTASSEKRSIKAFPLLGMTFSGKRNQNSTSCAMINHPRTRRPRESTHLGFGLAERNKRFHCSARGVLGAPLRDE